MRDSRRGQALTEALLMMILAASVLAAAGRLLVREWRLVRCSRALFETTHARLKGETWLSPEAARVALEEGEDEVRGEIRCEGATLRVRMQRLGGEGS